jgi:hypothetical protein
VVRSSSEPAQSYSTDNQPAQSYSTENEPAQSYSTDNQPAQSYSTDNQPAQSYSTDNQPAQSYSTDNEPAQSYSIDNQPDLDAWAQEQPDDRHKWQNQNAKQPARGRAPSSEAASSPSLSAAASTNYESQQAAPHDGDAPNQWRSSQGKDPSLPGNEGKHKIEKLLKTSVARWSR